LSPSFAVSFEVKGLATDLPQSLKDTQVNTMKFSAAAILALLATANTAAAFAPSGKCTNYQLSERTFDLTGMVEISNGFTSGRI